MLNLSNLSLVEQREILYEHVLQYSESVGGWYHDLPYELWHKLTIDNSMEDEYIRTILNNIRTIRNAIELWIIEVDNEISFISTRTFERMYADWVDSENDWYNQ